ncbi:MAG: hypothetical protein GF320_13845 [Armatimonadia bacterium]|nr:hypothetical protein [Armatimonadia bacterium]
MDIAKLLGSIVGGDKSALAGVAAGATREAGEAFGGVLANALGMGHTATPGAEAERAMTAGQHLAMARRAAADMVEADLAAAASLQEVGAGAVPPDAASLEDAGADVLTLALATALSTWADHQIGASGSEQVVTVEGRTVGSLVSDLPAALRQAIEATLAALDKADVPIPAGIMANLTAIREAVTVDQPTTLGGPLPGPQVQQFAGRLADEVIQAVSQRFDYGAGILEQAMAAIAEAEEGTTLDRTRIVEPHLPDRMKAEALMELLAGGRTAGTDPSRQAVESLLAALRGAIVRVETLVEGSPGSQGQADQVMRLLAEAMDALRQAGKQAGAPAGKVQTEGQPQSGTTGVLVTDPEFEIGTKPAYGSRSRRLGEVIEGSLRQGDAGKKGAAPTGKVDLAGAGAALVKNGLGEASPMAPGGAETPRPDMERTIRELLASSQQQPTAAPPPDGRLKPGEAGRTEARSTAMPVQGPQRGEGELSGEHVTRLLQVLSGRERVSGDEAVQTAEPIHGPGATAQPPPGTEGAAQAIGHVTGSVTAPNVAPQVAPQQPVDPTAGRVMEQVQQAVNQAQTLGRHEITIELKPPYLGDIQVTLRASEQAIAAHFHAESHTVKAMLESNMHLLRDMLQNAGLSADRLEVSVNSGGAGDGGFRNPGEATRLYRTMDPRHGASADEDLPRPVGNGVGTAYGLARVVDLLA